MRRLDLPLRAAGLILTGEFVVHELRYLIVPVGATEHGYLPLLAVLSIVVLAAAVGRLAGSLELARGTGRGTPAGLDFWSAWKLLTFQPPPAGRPLAVNLAGRAPPSLS